MNCYDMTKVSTKGQGHEYRKGVTNFIEVGGEAKDVKNITFEVGLQRVGGICLVDESSRERLP